MKTRAISIAIAILGCALFAGVALAQPNPEAEAEWQRYLANHPQVRADLINDPHYLSKNPGVANWLHLHPKVYEYARQQGQIGGWDAHNQWHDRDWWMHNDPGWVHEHHPEWVAAGPPPPVHEGEYDEHHRWRARDWWVKHHPNWVHEHHPEWGEPQAHDHH